MSEELGLGSQDLESQETEEIVEEATEEAPQLSEIEQRAYDQGWRPKDQFDGPEENWKPAKQYVEWGEMRGEIGSLKSQMKSREKQFDERLSNLNILHKAETERKIREVESRIKTAVEDGNTEEALALSTEKAELTQQKNTLDVKSDPNADAILQGEWELNNQWIFDSSDPRSRAAHTAFNLATAKGLPMSERLSYVDDQISKMPAQRKGNPNRALPADTTSSTVVGSKKKQGRKLTMKDLTPEELSYRDAFPDNEKGDKIFLQTVADMREGV